MPKTYLCLAAILFMQSHSALGQLTKSIYGEKIQVAVPFLLIPSDARTSSLGDAGSALTPSANSMGMFNAKGALLETTSGMNISYTPWLNSLVNDRKLLHFSSFYKLADRTMLNAGVNYLGYGTFDLIDDQRISSATIHPAEYAINLGISRKFGHAFALGTNLKSINSNLYSSDGSTAQVQSGTSLALDLSAFHQIQSSAYGMPMTFGLSFNILNIGPKMAYFENAEYKMFLPTMLKMATALTFEKTPEQIFSIALDISKPLVPNVSEPNSDTEQSSVLNGMINSFTDSENGLKGELREISASLGIEFLFQEKLAFRAGYNHQSPVLGMGSYLSFGSGFKYKAVNIDLSYIAGNVQKTFLGNSMRFSLGYSFSK